jgi:uncharacterized protein (DUF2235 family)
MKRFVICLDGTWNNASKENERSDGSKVYRPTNVLKMARATEKFDRDGVLQITYYDAGVGSMNRAPNFRTKMVRFFDNKLGGGWGAGFEVNIEEAYTFLANNYSLGDELFIFGFSRGASQARSLCTLIEWAGGFPAKSDVYYVPRLVSAYLDAQGQDSAKPMIANLNDRRRNRNDKPLAPFVVPQITFLGVWDTVLALGSRIQAKNGSSNESYQFHTPPTPPKTAITVRHGMAIDERRHDFQPEIFSGSGDCQDFEQRWFAGVHSNVGGGLMDDSLANCSLRWMCNEAADHGLSLNEEYLSFFRGYGAGRASEKTKFYKFGDTVMKPVRGFKGIRQLAKAPDAKIDKSVFDRLNADPAKHENLDEEYRSENLLAYLAADPSYDSELSPSLLETIGEFRKPG